MAEKYTPKDMIGKVAAFFADKDFVTHEYWDRLGTIRLPLYCEKQADGTGESEVEEAIVDIITERRVTKDDYLPDLEYGNC